MSELSFWSIINVNNTYAVLYYSNSLKIFSSSYGWILSEFLVDSLDSSRDQNYLNALTAWNDEESFCRGLRSKSLLLVQS